MKTLVSKAVLALSVIMISNISAFAVCNQDCMVRGPDYPCPTWSEPLRTCPSVIEDLGCKAGKLTCEGRLVACVAEVSVAYGLSNVCAGAIVADLKTAGAVTVPTAMVCGLAVEKISSAVERCK
jgi:hypothetical protein